MGKEIKCPLCDNNNVEFLEKINTNDIVNLWTKQNVDISKLFYGIESLNKLSCINCGLEFFGTAKVFLEKELIAENCQNSKIFNCSNDSLLNMFEKIESKGVFK